MNPSAITPISERPPEYYKILPFREKSAAIAQMASRYLCPRACSAISAHQLECWRGGVQVGRFRSRCRLQRLETAGWDGRRMYYLHATRTIDITCAHTPECKRRLRHSGITEPHPKIGFPLELATRLISNASCQLFITALLLLFGTLDSQLESIPEIRQF